MSESANSPTQTHQQQNTYQHLFTQPCPQTLTHTLPHLPTTLNYKITPTHHSSSNHIIIQHNTTLLLHRALQLIANPAASSLRVHYITQSHVQFHESIIAPQTGRNGAGEPISEQAPDETARGSAVVSSVVYCDDACMLGMRGVSESHCGGKVSGWVSE